MNISQLRFTGIITLSTSLFLTSSMGVLSATTTASISKSIEAIASPTTETQAQQSRPIFLAQTQNNCQKNESLFVAAETKDFWVNICGGDKPHSYIGVNKRNGKSIRLRLKEYDPQGNMFEALNGNVSYLLIRGTTKGNFLTVTEGTREILRQPVIKWE